MNCAIINILNFQLKGGCKVKVFGQRNHDLQFSSRTGAYAVIQKNSNEFLCVQDSDGHLFLVGGGVEKNESPEQALIRESIEETGHMIEIKHEIGRAERHWVSAKYPSKSQHNIGILYVCELLEKITEPIEEESMIWVTYDQLKKQLFHDHHLYLMDEYLKNKV